MAFQNLLATDFLLFLLSYLGRKALLTDKIRDSGLYIRKMYVRLIEVVDWQSIRSTSIYIRVLPIYIWVLGMASQILKSFLKLLFNMSSTLINFKSSSMTQSNPKLPLPYYFVTLIFTKTKYWIVKYTNLF